MHKNELAENKSKSVWILKDLTVGYTELKATISPTVTPYEIGPAARIRVAAVKKLPPEVAYNIQWVLSPGSIEQIKNKFSII